MYDSLCTVTTRGVKLSLRLLALTVGSEGFHHLSLSLRLQYGYFLCYPSPGNFLDYETGLHLVNVLLFSGLRCCRVRQLQRGPCVSVMSRQATRLDSIPFDIFYQIVSGLDCTDFSNLSQVNRTIHDLMSNESISKKSVEVRNTKSG